MAKIIATTDVPLAGWDGTGKPEVSEGAIRFNGVNPDDSHETFEWPPKLEPFEWTPANATFDFCKTAVKPYDKVVVACLLAAMDALGNHIEVSSDAGSITEAAADGGADLYRRALGREPPQEAETAR